MYVQFAKKARFQFSFGVEEFDKKTNDRDFLDLEEDGQDGMPAFPVIGLVRRADQFSGNVVMVDALRWKKHDRY